MKVNEYCSGGVSSDFSDHVQSNIIHGSNVASSYHGAVEDSCEGGSMVLMVDWS
jgi:hypothetical protein